jgi:hypothetical protein
MSFTFLVSVWLILVTVSLVLAAIVRRVRYKPPLNLDNAIVVSVSAATVIAVVSLLSKLYHHKGLQTELGLDGTMIYLIGCGVTSVVSIREVMKLF